MMKQKITFKLCLAMLGLLLSISAGAATYVGNITIESLEYTLYDDGTASVAAANYQLISGEIVIPASVDNNNKTYSVIKIDNDAFNGCSKLTAITIPNSVTTIGTFTFFDCSGLTSITIPNSVTTIGDGAFYKCSKLTAITIPNSVTTIGIFTFFDCSGLTSITIPNSVTTIGNYAFEACSGLTAITIPNSVTTIGKNVFSGCIGLKEFIVATDNPSYLSLDGILYNKQKTEIIQVPPTIKSVNIPNSITTIGNWAFQGCTELTVITIPNSVTKIGKNAFSGCTGLKEFIVAIDNPNYSSDGILYNKQKTEIIQVPPTIKSVNIPNSVTKIGNYAFEACSGLTSITIPNNVTKIGEGAFYRCSGLKEFIVATDNPNYSSLDGILYNKQQTEIIQAPLTIRSVNILNSVTTIGQSAFDNCNELTTITIPNSVKTIDNYAFFGCTGLQEIKVYIEEPITITEGVFKNVNCETCTLYVPQGSIEKYQAAAVWSQFTNISALADGSAIEGVDENKLNVYSVDGKVVIKNLREGEAIFICNTTGQNVYQGNETEVPLSKGIYLVKIGTIVSKVTVQ